MGIRPGCDGCVRRGPDCFSGGGGAGSRGERAVDVPSRRRPASAAATNTGDVVVLAAPGKIISVGPDGRQKAFPVALPGGAFGIGPTSRLDKDQLLQITPGGVITPIATNADGLLGAANMTLIHAGKSTIIYDANTGAPLFSTNTTGFGPALLKITIN